MFSTLSFASINTIESFDADFIQSVTDDKNKVITYSGHITAAKPKSAIWHYIEPVNKTIYINAYEVTIVEPEIEQVIVRTIESNFDFFNMIRDAKKVKQDLYEAKYKDSNFIIKTQNNLIKSISYIDEFENNVEIVFDKQKQNKKIDLKYFIPKYPLEFDLIRD